MIEAVRFAMVFVLAAGCGRVNFDPRVDSRDARDGAGDGAPDARVCAGYGSWSAPTLVPNLSNPAIDELGPALTNDQLTIFYQDAIDEYVAQRANVADDFGTGVKLGFDTATFQDHDVALARGGTRLYFSSDRNSIMFDDKLYYSDGSGTSFSSATEVSELGAKVYGPWVSDDETELFYSDGAHVVRATRATAAQPWVFERQLTELGVGGYPSLSRDRLTIYFEAAGAPYVLYTATRPAIGMPFGARTVGAPTPGVDVSDPFITDDNLTMYFAGHVGAGKYDLYVMTRPCL